MKALIFDGSTDDKNCPEYIKNIILEELKNKSYNVKQYLLRNEKISSCTGCSSCWYKKPGICVINDIGNNILQEIIQKDLIVLISPIIFGNVSFYLKNIVDRMFPLLLPFDELMKSGNTTRGNRYNHNITCIVIGFHLNCSKEEEILFKTIFRYNKIIFSSIKIISLPLSNDKIQIKNKFKHKLSLL